MQNADRRPLSLQCNKQIIAKNKVKTEMNKTSSPLSGCFNGGALINGIYFLNCFYENQKPLTINATSSVADLS